MEDKFKRTFSYVKLPFLAGPDPIEHATGIEKWELQQAQAGNDVSKSA